MLVTSWVKEVHPKRAVETRLKRPAGRRSGPWRAYLGPKLTYYPGAMTGPTYGGAFAG